MISTQVQIKKIFQAHFPQYETTLNFVEKLGCDNKNGMCYKFNNNRKFIYQYLPVPIPKSPAKYIFICKEPSTPWAKGTSDAFEKVFNNQFMNFISGEFNKNKLDIMILAFRKVFHDQVILITDMSKCAINVDEADKLGFDENLEHRYICCAPYLKWELTNLAIENPNIFIVGKNYFFMEWYKKCFPSMKNEKADDVLFFSKFLEEAVQVKIPEKKIVMLPHYSIRFSCPEYILRMLNKEKKEIEDEIKCGLKELYNNYLSNFILTQSVKEKLNQTIVDIDKVKLDKDFSDSIILLYLLYKNEFALAHEQWEQKK